MISGSLDRRFPGIKSCGDTVQLLNELILTELLQFPGLLLFECYRYTEYRACLLAQASPEQGGGVALMNNLRICNNPRDRAMGRFLKSVR